MLLVLSWETRSLAQASLGDTKETSPPDASETSVAWVDIQRIAEVSAEGRIANAKVQILIEEASAKIAPKYKELDALQQKMEVAATVLNSDSPSLLEKQINRLKIEIRRLEEDAQREVRDLQIRLQQDLEVRLMPVIQAFVQDRNIKVLFSRNDSGIILGDQALDLTAEIIKRFDATSRLQTAPVP